MVNITHDGLSYKTQSNGKFGKLPIHLFTLNCIVEGVDGFGGGGGG